MASPDTLPDPSRPQLAPAALFWRFLKFGALAFGGPVAQIAMIRQQLVEEERWITPAQFNRLVAVMQVLPGPEAHELCVHLGVRAGGRIGGLLAGLGFMAPGFVLMLALGWLYTQLAITGTLFAALFLGVQAAVIALIIRAVHRIGGHILANVWLWAIAVAAAGLTLAGASFWIVLPVAGLCYALAAGGRPLLAGLVLVAAGASLALPPLSLPA
ncbi:chromate transporter, partial [Sandarakinorhabdus oryzae]|uniref:chromate transporter n=1 Tax=Sandarakinorhabdus oryzae TaxID=2675220 RepID=UPI0018CC0E32